MAATLAKLAGKTPKEIAGLGPAQLEPIARFAMLPQQSSQPDTVRLKLIQLETK